VTADGHLLPSDTADALTALGATDAGSLSERVMVPCWPCGPQGAAGPSSDAQRDRESVASVRGRESPGLSERHFILRRNKDRILLGSLAPPQY
jgi:hypothetical protein